MPDAVVVGAGPERARRRQHAGGRRLGRARARGPARARRRGPQRRDRAPGVRPRPLQLVLSARGGLARDAGAGARAPRPAAPARGGRRRAPAVRRPRGRHLRQGPRPHLRGPGGARPRRRRGVRPLDGLLGPDRAGAGRGADDAVPARARRAAPRRGARDAAAHGRVRAARRAARPPLRRGGVRRRGPGAAVRRQRPARRLRAGVRGRRRLRAGARGHGPAGGLPRGGGRRRAR